MKKTLFHLILVALAVSSCATAKYYGGFTRESAREDMALMGPVSCIYYLDEKNHESFNDTLSAFSETLVANLVDELGVPVTGRIELNDDEKSETFDLMHYLASSKAKKQEFFPIPGLLDRALEEEGHRYGLLVFAEGMTRDKKGYTKDAVKGAFITLATAILTLGTAVMVTTPEMYSSRVYAAVLDSETDQVVFFNVRNPEETHPLRPDPVREQLSKLLKDFLK